MSATLLRWTVDDFAAMGPYSAPKSTSYPYLVMDWSADNAAKHGVGVLQAQTSKGSISPANLFYLPAYQNIFQWLLENDPDIASFPMVNDGGGYTPSTKGDVTLPQLLTFMLAPVAAAAGAPAVPSTNFAGNFDPVRLWCVNPILPRALPLVNDVCGSGGSPFFGFYTVIPPFGYVNTGAYFVGTNPSGQGYLYPGSQLQFLLKDARFAQPGPNGYVKMPNYQSYNVFGSNPFVASVTQSVVGSSNLQNFTYQYTPLSGIMSWQVSPGALTAGGYTMSSFPNDFPWAINTQLLRIFPDGPRNTFSTLVQERWLWSASSSCLSGGQPNLEIYAANPRQHPCFVFSYTGSQVFPVVAFWSLYNVLACCTTQIQFSDYIWNFAAYALPVGVSSAVTNLNQALCLAGTQGSFNYVPGTDCDIATGEYCDPSQAEYSQPTCSCYNTDAMLASVGLTPNPTDPSQAELVATLTANITCVDTECLAAGSFKPSKAPGVAGNPCPAFQNCSISGTSTDGGNIGKLENNCTSNPGGAPLSSLTAAQWIMIVAAILFVVMMFLLLIERHNRKKMTKQLEKGDQDKNSSAESSK